MDYCLICNAPVKNYEPVHCCTQKDCGCMGAPTKPCVCSIKCKDALFAHSGTMDERRIAAGIKKHVERTTLRIYAVKGNPYFVTGVWGAIRLGEMEAIQEALYDEDECAFWFGDLPDNVEEIECKLRWDIYDYGDGSYPVFDDIVVVSVHDHKDAAPVDAFDGCPFN